MTSELIFFTVVGVGVVGFLVLACTRNRSTKTVELSQQVEKIVSKQLLAYDENVRAYDKNNVSLRESLLGQRVDNLQAAVGRLENVVGGLVAFASTISPPSTPDKKRKRGQAQQEIIAYLRAKTSCTASDLVRELGYAKPTVLKIADKLLKLNLIEKSYKHGRLTLTIKGEE